MSAFKYVLWPGLHIGLKVKIIKNDETGKHDKKTIREAPTKRKKDD